MNNTETDPFYKKRLEKAIEKFKKWCFDNPAYVGKDCCQDCTHLIDPEQYGGCSGPPLDRNDLCEPGYQQFELNYPRDDSIYPCDYE